MASLRDVAKAAGVSTATVSHVINGTHFVSDERRERVLEAVKALNYKPNSFARGLRTGRSQTIGLIVPDSSNSYFSELAWRIEELGFARGYNLIVCNSHRDQTFAERQVSMLIEQRVCGILMVSTSVARESLEGILSENVGVVIVDREADCDVHQILVDNYAGGFAATQHLLGLGHRRIACVSSPVGARAERLRGFRAAMQAEGAPIDESMILAEDQWYASGYKATKELIRREVHFTAIFAGNDLMAVGALRALQESGRRVPQDCSVIGYDNIGLGAFTFPALTTIRQPIDEIAENAVRLLTEDADPEDRAVERLVLRPKQALVIRESTGRAPE